MASTSLKTDRSSVVSKNEIEIMFHRYKSDTDKLTFLGKINQEVDKIRRESK
jgi:hypothetical protein